MFQRIYHLINKNIMKELFKKITNSTIFITLMVFLVIALAVSLLALLFMLKYGIVILGAFAFLFISYKIAISIKDFDDD